MKAANSIQEENNRPASELTRLKLLWKKWPDEEQQKVLGWREEEIEPGKLVTNKVVRDRIKKYYGINLVRDGQLSEFWSWVSSRRADEAMNDFMAAREQAFVDSHPDWTRDAIRDAMIKEWYSLAHATGDAKLGLKVVKADLQDRGQTFEETKFKESLRTKLQAGLDAVAEAFKTNPEAMNFYQRARSMIAAETK